MTCTFVNARERGAILIQKTRKHAADGPGNHPHAGVSFNVSGGNLPAGGSNVQTGSDGSACIDGLLLSGFAGDYTVTETVPAGYSLGRRLRRPCRSSRRRRARPARRRRT